MAHEYEYEFFLLLIYLGDAKITLNAFCSFHLFNYALRMTLLVSTKAFFLFRKIGFETCENQCMNKNFEEIL